MLRPKEGFEFRQPGAKRVELDQHPNGRCDDQQQPHGERPRREQPADLGVQPVQQRLRIEAAKTQRQRIAETFQPLTPLRRLPLLKQHVRLAGSVRHDQSFAMQQRAERLQLAMPQLARRKLPLECRLNLVGRSPAVQLLQHKKLFGPQMIVTQRQRIFDAQIGPPAKRLDKDDQVGTLDQRQRAGGGGCRRTGHGNWRRRHARKTTRMISAASGGSQVFGRQEVRLFRKRGLSGSRRQIAGIPRAAPFCVWPEGG